MKLESFPSAVGTTWTYEWEDRLRGVTDTVIVTVTEELDSSDVGPAKTWQFEHADTVDTLFMVVGGDTVRFLVELIPKAGHPKFVFPLYVGAGWRGDYPTDSSLVIDAGPISVPAGHFSRAFQIDESWGAYNYYGWVTTWIVPEVGIVLEDRREIFGPSYVRRLLSYQVAERG